MSRLTLAIPALAALVAAAPACFPEYSFPGDVADAAAQDVTAPTDTGAKDGNVPIDAGGDDGAAPIDAGGTDAPVDTGRDAAPIVSLDGCVLLLHMDEAAWPAAGRPVKDSSGARNDGAAVGTAVPTAAGKFGGAASLDGSGWIDVADSASLHVTNAVTYTAWINPTGLTDGTPSPGVISKRHGFGDAVAFTLFLWTANQAWVDITSTRFNSDFVFANTNWYHVAVVYEGAATDSNRRARIYVNGNLDKPSTTADTVIGSNVEDILIGNLPGGGNAFVGKIDEVAIWSRVLSDAEISALAKATGPL